MSEPLQSWNVNTAIFRLRTSQDPRFDSALPAVTDLLDQMGFEYSSESRKVFHFSNGHITPLDQSLSCYSDQDNALVFSPGQIDFATTAVDDFKFETTLKRFHELKNQIGEPLKFLRIRGIFSRVVITQNVREFPNQLAGLASTENLWNTFSGKHVHNELTHWEDTQCPSLPGRITLNVNTVKSHNTKANDLDLYLEKILQQNPDGYNFFCDCNENSNELATPLELAADVTSSFDVQLSRIEKLIAAVREVQK